MRVLNVCETAQGGVGVYQALLAGLESRGIEMHHLVPAQHAAFLPDGLRVAHFDRPRRGIGATAALLRAFARERARLQPDLCFFHSTFSLAALAAMRLRRDPTPALYCPHGWAAIAYGDTPARAAAIRLVEGRLAGLADRVLCVSAGEEAHAVRHGYRGRRVIVENGVRDSLADPRPTGSTADEDAPISLLFVGRLDRQKGFDILRDAMRLVRRTDIRLTVIGARVRDTADGAMVPDAVPDSRRPAPEAAPGAEPRMLGWVPNTEIDGWYAAADAVVVPSRWEGLPLVIPEALRNGTPVLCARRSGMDSLVEPGATGAHFDLDPAALAALLQSLDRASLLRMRPACRAAWEARFTVDRMLDGIEAVMRSLVAR